MPTRLQISATFDTVADSQDGVASMSQLLASGYTRRAVHHRIASGVWQWLLQDVVLLFSGVPTRRQQIVGALLWAGPLAAVDGIDACRYWGIVQHRAAEDEPLRLVVPWGSGCRSQSFVRVRRCVRPITPVSSEYGRYLAPADAVVAAGRGLRSTRDIVALYGDALRTPLVSIDQLIAAHHRGSPRGRTRADAALEAVGGGAMSAAEADGREVLLSSQVLPAILFNQPLQLPSRRVVVPDALIVDSGLVHEVNGRRWHEREDRFDDMQSRHDAMTASGLVLLHNSPARLLREPGAALAEVEQTHLRYAGRGLPAGIVLLPKPRLAPTRR